MRDVSSSVLAVLSSGDALSANRNELPTTRAEAPTSGAPCTSSSFLSSTPGRPAIEPPMKLSETVKLISIRWLAGRLGSEFLRISTWT